MFPDLTFARWNARQTLLRNTVRHPLFLGVPLPFSTCGNSVMMINGADHGFASSQQLSDDRFLEVTDEDGEFEWENEASLMP
jgi:hypothetical protein